MLSADPCEINACIAYVCIILRELSNSPHWGVHRMQNSPVQFNTRFTVADHNFRDYLQVSSTYASSCKAFAPAHAPEAMMAMAIKMAQTPMPATVPKTITANWFASSGVADSQWTPVLEGGHVQLYPVVEFIHVPPCLHGWSMQEYRRSQNMPAQEVGQVQLKPCVVLRHVAPFLQGWSWQLYCRSQNMPAQEVGQVQLNPCVVLRHVAPFWHGLSRQVRFLSQNQPFQRPVQTHCIPAPLWLSFLHVAPFLHAASPHE